MYIFNCIYVILLPPAVIFELGSLWKKQRLIAGGSHVPDTYTHIPLMLRFNKRMYYFEVDPSLFIFNLPGTGCDWISHSNHADWSSHSNRAWSERSTQRVGLLQALGEPGFTSPLREMPMEKGTCPQAYFPRHQSIYAQSFKHISVQSYPRTNTTNKGRCKIVCSHSPNVEHARF